TVHTVRADLLPSRRDRDESRGALSVDRHPGNAGRQTRTQRRVPGQVAAGWTLLQGAAEDDVLHLCRIEPRTFDCMRDGMGGKGLPLGVVECAAVRFPDGCAGDGNDDGFSHGSPGLSGCLWWVQWAPTFMQVPGMQQHAIPQHALAGAHCSRRSSWILLPSAASCLRRGEIEKPLPSFGACSSSFCTTVCSPIVST